MNIHRSHLNCCTIANLKTRRRSNTLKGFQRMGGGRIFLKNLRDTTFNKDLWHEPNFARIHISGQKALFHPSPTPKLCLLSQALPVHCYLKHPTLLTTSNM